MTDTSSPDDVYAEIRTLASELSDNHVSLDVDDLDDDATFTRLVALLADRSRTPDDIFEAAIQDSSKWVRAAALSAIATGRPARPGWTGRATTRFRRAGYDESCFLLRALAEAPEPVMIGILQHAGEGWSGSAIAERVSEFLDGRVRHGERWTAADLGRLDAGLQEIVADIVEGTEPETREALRPAVEEWQLGTIDVEFFAELGRIIEPEKHPRPTIVGSRAVAVDAVVATLSPQSPKSILLVGEDGVGKTTLVVEALRRLEGRFGLAFQATAADVNAGQTYIGMLEGRVHEIVGKLARRRVVWVFPNFEDSLWSGQHLQSPRGLLDVLLPAVESGDATIVGEIDPVAYERLLQHRPRVVRLFDVVRLAPMTNDEALSVGRGWAQDNGVDVDAGTLAEALDLASHYLPATAAPGNLLRLLELVRDRMNRGLATAVTPETIIATLSEATGLPLHVLDPRAPLNLGDVRQFFASRVLGQPDAVTCLVERIALVKAGLTDPTRPLGVFLFVGPTGTGKTEIAKTLGAFLFGSEERLVRLDMSEYQTEASLERLLGDATTEKRAAPLIAAVRRQPFSVLLLDEFEKADKSVWDIFLQVFDDGRLTDRNGRTVDLRHCVIILTSNLGSAIPRGVQLGFGADSPTFEPETVLKAVKQSFRPEFLNRLDRVVVFRPLGREMMRGLLENELNSVLRRRGLRMQPWAVEWDEAAVDYLIEQGFSAELGARPLKRAVEQHLLTRIATTIVERKFPEGDQFLFITATRNGLEVTFVDPDLAEDEPPASPVGAELTVAAIALDPQGSAAEAECLRSELARVSESIHDWTEAKSEALEAMRAPHFWESDERHGVLSRIEYLDRLSAAGATAERLTARLDTARETQSRELVGMLARRLHVLDAALRGLEAAEPADAEIVIRAVHGDDSPAAEAAIQKLAEMYASWADGRGMRAHRHDAERGQALTVTGLGAFTLLRPEAGLHVFEVPTRDRSFRRVSALVTVAPRDQESRAGEAEPPQGSEPTVVRRYREAPSPLVRDASGTRTGRIDRVLGGDFDLIGESASARA
jgi:ATP-dependent Clp protease ATP-binding subunit ClpC